jgi:hypothetical protein
MAMEPVTIRISTKKKGGSIMQQKNSVDRKHREKTEKSINRSRRNALKTIAAGTAADQIAKIDAKDA